MMELTLTGASTVSDNAASSLHTDVPQNNGTSNNQLSNVNASHSHSHGHHNHPHNGGGCCSAHAAAGQRKINASALLPSREQVQRFKKRQTLPHDIASQCD